MKSSLSLFNEPNKFQSEYTGKISRKSRISTASLLISPKSKLQFILCNNHWIDKNGIEQKKIVQKNKNIHFINLGADNDELNDFTPYNQISDHFFKSKQNQDKQKKKKIRNENKKYSLKMKSYKSANHSQSQQKVNQFSILQPDKQKENLIKFEKQLISNLMKKKQPKKSTMLKFNDTFKKCYEAYKRRSTQRPTLQIKKQMIHQVPKQQQERGIVKYQRENVKTATSSISLNCEENKKYHLNIIHSNKYVKTKDGNLKYKNPSSLHNCSKYNLNETSQFQNQVPENYGYFSIYEPVKNSQNLKIHNQFPKNFFGNSKIQEINRKIEYDKFTAVNMNLRLKKIHFQKFQSALQRSQTHLNNEKSARCNKKPFRNIKSEINSRALMKSRNTCPINYESSSVFTPWDNLNSERQNLDFNN